MKRLKYLAYALVSIFLLASCDKDETKVYLSDKPTAPALLAPAASASIVMTKPEAAKTVTFTWTAAEYGVKLGVQYTLQMDVKGNNFKNAVAILSSNNLTETITYDALNTKCTALGLENAKANDVELRVVTTIPTTNVPSLTSAAVAIQITPYSNKDKLFMVGAFINWDANKAIEMNADLPGLEYNLFAYLPAGSEFKFIPTKGAWANDMGASKTEAGKLVVNDEDNLKVTDAGVYEVQLNLNTMTWVINKQVFGLIGSATPGGWNESTPMILDPATRTYSCTLNLIGGNEFKFRANDKWDYNFGDNGNDGTLEAGGANIPVAASGNYTITLKIGDAVAPVVAPAQYPVTYTYTIKKN